MDTARTTLQTAALAAIALIGLGLNASAQEDAQPVKTYTEKGESMRWLAQDDPEVAMSVRVPSLQPGDTVLGFAEFTVTNDLRTKSKHPGVTPFKGEYRYTILLTGRLNLARGTGLDDGRAIGDGKAKVTPNNHHGLLVVDGATRVESRDAGADTVNLVARSEIPGAKRAPGKCIRIDYEGFVSPPGGKCLTRVEKKGQLDVVVLSTGWQETWQSREVKTGRNDVRVGELRSRQEKVAVSLALGPVKKGEVFVASGRVRAKSTQQGMTHQLLAGTFVLSDDPKDTSKKHRVSAHHGFNVNAGADATLRKVCAFTADRDYDRAFLNLVINSEHDAHAQEPRLAIDAGRTGIEVTRFSARTVTEAAN